MWICPNCAAPVAHADALGAWAIGWRCGHCAVEIARFDTDIPCLAPDLIGTASGFDPEFFETLVRFEETSFWFVRRAQLIVALLRKHFGSARNFLEVGCGTGSVLLALKQAVPELKLTGSELHPEGLSFAKRRLGGGVNLIQMDARAIPARDEFDVVGAFDVIEHIPEDEQVLQEMQAAVKRGGGVMVAVPQHPWLWSPADEAAHHERRYGRGELERKLIRAGFQIVHSTSFNALLLPLMMISRELGRRRAKRGALVNPLSEFEMPGWLNSGLSSALGLEVELTKRGIRWPFGGSRLVVAQKRGPLVLVHKMSS